MAHKEQLEYIRELKAKFKKNFVSKKVLEIGSLNINGSVRQYFECCDYLGIDVGEGKGVDLVVSGHEYDAASESYDTVISCECFEHNPFWLETFTNMHRMCKVGGLIIMTCATTGRPEHGTTRTSPKDSPLTLETWDYYGNLTENDFTDKIDIASLFSEFKFSVNYKHRDLQFYGFKR